MKVVDTTVLIDHARGNETVAQFLADHDDVTLIVSTISFQELAVGEVSARGETLEAILSNLGAFDIRDYTAEQAYNAAVIEAELRANGKYEPVLARDILIGGVARTYSIPVVTSNITHFSRFDGVDVDTY